MDPTDFFPIFFWVAVGAGVGAAIGDSRNNRLGGLVLGALLGPIGWVLILFADCRPECGACRGRVPTGATRCMHCGQQFSFAAGSPPPPPDPVAEYKKWKSENTPRPPTL